MGLKWHFSLSHIIWSQVSDSGTHLPWLVRPDEIPKRSKQLSISAWICDSVICLLFHFRENSMFYQSMVKQRGVPESYS